MEIIDILSQPESASCYFQVNTGLSFVQLQPCSSGIGKHIRADTKYKFSRGDNVVLLSVGFILPLSFELWESGNHMPTRLQLKAGQDDLTQDLFEPPGIFIPFENYELNCGVFLEAPNCVDFWTVDFEIENLSVKISMLNVPASLDESQFHVPVFCKVLHTIPMLTT